VDRRAFLGRSATVAAALAVAPEALARRSGGGTPLVLVTADQQEHVVAVDHATGKVRGRIATLPGPRSIEAVRGTTALVAHTTEGAVSLLDPATMTVERGIRGFGEPRYTAVHPTGRYAYVSDSQQQEIVTVDVGRRQIVNRTHVPGPARHLSHDPHSPWLWTALGNKATHLALLTTRNPRRPMLSTVVRTPVLAHDVVFEPDGRRAWVTSGDSRTVAVYEARTAHPRVLMRLAADAAPQHVVFHYSRAFVASGDDGSLRTHDRSSGRLLGRTDVPGGSYNVASYTPNPGWGRIVTPSLARGTLTLLDRRGRIADELQVARAAHDACIVVA